MPRDRGGDAARSRRRVRAARSEHLPFEIRWGAKATSSRLRGIPTTRMIQVAEHAATNTPSCASMARHAALNLSSWTGGEASWTLTRIGPRAAATRRDC